MSCSQPRQSDEPRAEPDLWARSGRGERNVAGGWCGAHGGNNAFAGLRGLGVLTKPSRQAEADQIAELKQGRQRQRGRWPRQGSSAPSGRACAQEVRPWLRENELSSTLVSQPSDTHATPYLQLVRRSAEDPRVQCKFVLEVIFYCAGGGRALSRTSAAKPLDAP